MGLSPLHMISESNLYKHACIAAYGHMYTQITHSLHTYNCNVLLLTTQGTEVTKPQSPRNPPVHNGTRSWWKRAEIKASVWRCYVNCPPDCTQQLDNQTRAWQCTDSSEVAPFVSSWTLCTLESCHACQKQEKKHSQYSWILLSLALYLGARVGDRNSKKSRLRSHISTCHSENGLISL